MQTLPEIKKIVYSWFWWPGTKTMAIKNVNTFAQSSDLYFCVVCGNGFL